MHRSCFGLLSAAGLTLALSGCEKGAGAGAGVQQELPQIAVKLPPPPSFKKEHAPEKYTDESLSVYGVRALQKTTLNQEVRVRGYILEVYECPKCPKGSECPPCQKPHFWLSDRANGPKDKALMVTDYPPEDERRRKTKFSVGLPYHVSGTFAKSSATGFSSSEGLLIFASAAPVPSE